MLQNQWFVYVLLSDCKQRTYVGASTDVGRRLEEHNGKGTKGAKSTRAGRPWAVATTYGPFPKNEALSIEHRVKKLRGKRRLLFEV